MGQPKIEILGAYRVPVDEELFEKAMELKFPDGRTPESEKAVRDQLSSIALIEVRVTDVDEGFDVGDFTQGVGDPSPNDQVAYDEAYLSDDGESVISRGFENPRVKSSRTAFFLHFYDPSLPLRTSYGPLVAPPLDEMPERLRKMMPYEPVD